MSLSLSHGQKGEDNHRICRSYFSIVESCRKYDCDHSGAYFTVTRSTQALSVAE